MRLLMKIHRLVFLLGGWGVALHSDALAAPTLLQCDDSPSNNHFDSGASCGGLCDWVQDSTGQWAISCDLDVVSNNTNRNSIEAVTNVDYDDDEIVIRAFIDMDGSNTEYCCLYKDTQLEVENVALFGTENDDYIAFREGGLANLTQLTASGAPKLWGWAYGRAGADRMRGSVHSVPTEYQESLFGGDGLDYIWGYGGKDTIVGGGGIDYIDAGAQDDTIDAGSGDNVVVGAAGNNTITAGSGNDYICASGASGEPGGIELNWDHPSLFVPSGGITYDPNTWGITCTSAGGNDDVDAGNGNNKVASGLGIDNIKTGTGADMICLDGAGMPDEIRSGFNDDTNDVVYVSGSSPSANIQCGAGSSDNATMTSGTRANCELSTVSSCPF